MITSTGRDIISKYLIGQTTSYASHIAIGSGATPSTTLGFYADKTELDFEIDRFPIIARSISTEEIVFNATQVQATGTTFVFTLTNGHLLKSGQTIQVTGCGNFNNAPDPATNANGQYTILSTTATTITVTDSALATTPQTLTNQTIDIYTYIPQIVLSAEIPTTVADRYEITEFGIYPSGTNIYPNGTDSYMLANFTQNESWQYVQYISSVDSDFSNVPYYSTITDATNNITITDKAFLSNAENVFFNATRIARQERPRYKSDALFLAGNLSEFTADRTPSSTSNYISLPFTLDLSQNSADDELRLAFSLISAKATPTTTPLSLNILIQFVASNGFDTAQYHFRSTDATSLISGTGAFTSSRYKVFSLPLASSTSTLVSRTSNFDWKNVRSLRIYASVENAATYAGTALSDFTICLDALRFENKSNTNPLYGLTGYTIVNTAGIPIVRDAGTSSLVEFKFATGVTSYV